MMDILTLTSSVLPDSARVIGFHGTEGISRPYELQVCFTLPEADAQDFDLLDAVGAKGLLTIDRGDPAVPPFLLAGVLGAVELLSQTGDRVLFRATLVPRWSQLALSRHSRVFSRMSFPEVLTAVLLENGLTTDDYEMRLGAHEIEEHICQYRESDLAFLSRWMEREGIYYHFEHDENGERIVFRDSMGYEAEALGIPVRYHPQSGDVSAGACFRTFTCRVASLPASVRLRDYDYTRPRLDVVGAAPVSSTGTGEVNLYGERFFTPAAGDRLARIRAEELLARQIVYHADGTRLHLRPGRTFELEDHPRAAFNARYLAIEVTHHGNQSQGASFDGAWQPAYDDVYVAEVSAIPATTQFRAESRTPWPRIYGFENGFVDGPADSDYAQIDEHGRYKVKLHFDESSLKGGAASTFLRMMQPHGGAVEGFHFPLRKGTEVLILFLGGDPDRPVISGVAPNALTPSPVTVNNHTTNVIQTGGKNRIEIEDAAGAEQIKISTPMQNTFLSMGAPWISYNLFANTNGRAGLHVGQNLDVLVEGAKLEGVKLDVTELYHASHNTYMDGADGNRLLHIAHGGYYAGIDKAFSVTAKESVTFCVNYPGGVPGTTPSEGFTVKVREDGIKLEAEQQDISLTAHRDVYITSTDGNFIHVNNKTGYVSIHAKAGVNIVSEGQLSIHSDKGIDITATEKINVEGKKDAVNVTQGDTRSLTLGNTIAATIGNTTTGSLGDSDSVAIGAKRSMTMGPELSLAVAASLGFSLAARLNVDAGLTAGLSMITFSHSVFELKFGDIKAEKKALMTFLGFTLMG